MWTVTAGKTVKRRLDRIPNPDNKRIRQAIVDLSDERKREQLDIKPLVGTDEYRMRIGSWRLIIKINEEQKTIFIRALASRGDVYKK